MLILATGVDTTANSTAARLYGLFWPLDWIQPLVQQQSDFVVDCFTVTPEGVIRDNRNWGNRKQGNSGESDSGQLGAIRIGVSWFWTVRIRAMRIRGDGNRGNSVQSEVGMRIIRSNGSGTIGIRAIWGNQIQGKSVSGQLDLGKLELGQFGPIGIGAILNRGNRIGAIQHHMNWDNRSRGISGQSESAIGIGAIWAIGIEAIWGNRHLGRGHSPSFCEAWGHPPPVYLLFGAYADLGSWEYFGI